MLAGGSCDLKAAFCLLQVSLCFESELDVSTYRHGAMDYATRWLGKVLS